jgi:hypothetical protein
METLFEASWRLAPSIALIVVGALLAVRGTARELRAYRACPGDALAMIRGFRIAIIGTSLVTLGFAWEFQLPWLAILAALILGEEMFEASLIEYGLTKGPSLRLRP